VLSLDHGPTPGPVRHSERWVGIVDDDASIRGSLTRVMRMEGISVETFASAEEFLERIVHGPPDCLVLDVHLGELSGFDLQDYLTSKGGAPPIIFITAHDEIPSSRLGSRTGASGFLRKPFEMAALIALVRPFFRRDGADRARS
jgi:FixJ family two-component response regulator